MSLIDEVHHDWQVRKKRRNVKLVILGGALVGLIYCAKLGYDYHRLEQGLELAGQSYADDSLEKWKHAQLILSNNLDIDGSHAASLSARALVSARIALAETDSIEKVRKLVTVGFGSSPEGNVARGIVAWMNGDEDAAWKFAYQAIDDGDQGDFSPGCGQWLALWLAWQSDQVGATGPAGIDFVHNNLTKESAKTWIEKNGERPSFHRVLGRWLFRWGHHKQGLERIEFARNKFPEHLGLAVDEAWMQISRHQKAAAVVELSNKLRSDAYAKSLSENDKRILALAKGAALLDLGQMDAAKQEFKEIWSKLPDWERVGRRLQLEFVLRQAKYQWINQWLTKDDGAAAYDQLDAEKLGLPEAEVPWIQAWIAFARGDVAQSLVTLAELDQQAPRTAYLQGLALVEQQRWSEAWPWLERAANLLPNRLEIEIAKLRAASYLKPTEMDEEKHRAMLKVSPYLFRVWSSLGVHLAVHSHAVELQKEEEERRKTSAIEAFEQAILYEPWPAEARLQLALFLKKPKLGRRMREDDVEAFKKIRTHLEAAVEDCPKRPRYREVLAEFLAEFGYIDEALEQLTIASEVENDIISALTPLRMIELKALQLIGYGYIRFPRKNADAKLAEKMTAWLEQAAKLGAQAPQMAIARAYIALLSKNKDALASSFAELSTLSHHLLDDYRAVSLWLRLMVEVEGSETAEEALSDRLRKLKRKYQARPRILLANLKSRGGDPRQAARLAWGGWRMLLSSPENTANELLEAAQSVVGHWTAIRQKSGAYRAVRDITRLLGYHPQAWRIRANLEFAEDNPGAACDSVQKALKIAPEDKATLKLAKKCPKAE